MRNRKIKKHFQSLEIYQGAKFGRLHIPIIGKKKWKNTLQFTIKTNLLAELKHQAPNYISN